MRSASPAAVINAGTGAEIIVSVPILLVCVGMSGAKVCIVPGKQREGVTC
ncbi:hypothetical protein FBBNIHIM_03690 [Pseudocitrobacter vendiensis]|uniref:Uncharacterized protein n=1 Tax=Pseudocitrobacter vendiensis TaxID=2488306 RepID=A0ABM9F5A7_9ENTR|nr:hypothetical protein FBBNIHIM_03690 [Pseudocitrobacter vendiensis]